MVSILAYRSGEIHSDESARSAHRAIRKVHRRRHAQCFGVPPDIALEQLSAVDGAQISKACCRTLMRWRKDEAGKADFSSRCAASSGGHILRPRVRSRTRSRYALKADIRQLAAISRR